MINKVDLNKNVKEKNQYSKIIDTNFKQLVPTPVVDNTPSIDDKIVSFFKQYEELFISIPAQGTINSHEYLIKQSSAFINFQPTDDDVQALLDEITSLRQENLNLQQQIVNKAIPNG